MADAAAGTKGSELRSPVEQVAQDAAAASVELLPVRLCAAEPAPDD